MHVVDEIHRSVDIQLYESIRHSSRLPAAWRIYSDRVEAAASLSTAVEEAVEATQTIPTEDNSVIYVEPAGRTHAEVYVHLGGGRWRCAWTGGLETNIESILEDREWRVMV